MRSPLVHVCLASLLAGCGAPRSGNAAAGADPTAMQNASAEMAQPQSSSTGRPFRTSEVTQFETPWAMDFLPGSGRPITNMALVTEREGRLWLVDVGTGARQQVAGVPQVRVAGQGGLGDVVAHPDFAGNRRVYLSFVEAGSGGNSGAVLGYGTLALGEGQPRLENFRVIWRQQPKVSGSGHFSHRIAFAPDGTLFLSSGDRQKGEPAQDPNSDLGKILHLTAEGQPIPANPWTGEGGRRALQYSMGHRNVLGLDFAPDGRLWASEMGPRGGDELNLILPGRNYGWPEVSYGSEYSGAPIPDSHRSRGFEEPRAWWTPSVSPGSLLIYSGDLFPQWKGDALLGALSGQALIHVDIQGDTARKAGEWDMDARIRAVAQGPDGAVYLLEDGESPGQGRMLKLVPTR